MTQKTRKNTQPALVFIHGFRGNHIGLEAIAREFPDYKVYIPDIPPFGTAGDLQQYTPANYAKFIADYITRHHLQQPILIGHSMGSLVAAATAAKYPQKLNDKLILLAPISVKPPKPIASLQPLVTILPNKFIGWLTTRYLYIPDRHADRELYHETLKLTYEGGAQYTSRQAVRQSARFSASHSLRDFNFHKKTLLLAGEKDRLIARRHTIQLATKLNSRHYPVTAQFIKGAGHLLNYEKPAETAAKIRQFIEK